MFNAFSQAVIHPFFGPSLFDLNSRSSNSNDVVMERLLGQLDEGLIHPSTADLIVLDLPLSDTDLSSGATPGTAASNCDRDDLERNCVQCGRYWKWRWSIGPACLGPDTCQHCRDTATHMTRLQWSHLTRLCLAQHADACAACRLTAHGLLWEVYHKILYELDREEMTNRD